MDLLQHARERMSVFQARLSEHDIAQALVTDESSIAYLAGFWGYLGVEFGRPSCLLVRQDDAPIVITPALESEMIGRMTWIEDVRSWHDAGSEDWRAVLTGALGADPAQIGIEAASQPALVRNFLQEHYPRAQMPDVTPILGSMRMLKSAFEIQVMRQAGEIGTAMMQAARDSLAEGTPEYESALAVIAAGTRTAAGFLTARGWQAFVSPMIHNLQIMQSGPDTAMVHRRASVRRLQRGDPVYFCFCNMLEFMHYRLGFDRMFFIGEPDPAARRAQETAIRAQAAALDCIRPGVEAESVAAAANEVYRSAGFEPGYRTGRSIGVAYLEAPELKIGDPTRLAPGMTFAVDGGVSLPGRGGGRIGDSIVVTETGYDFLTRFPRHLQVVT